MQVVYKRLKFKRNQDVQTFNYFILINLYVDFLYFTLFFLHCPLRTIL